MIVYLLETGCYENAGVQGVYASPADAMAAWHPKPGALMRGHEYGQHAGKPWPYTWECVDGKWHFGADWDDAAEITEYEVEGMDARVLASP